MAAAASFLEKIRRTKAHLEDQGRVSLGALKIEFGLDDRDLEALVVELVDVQGVALREGAILHWAGRTDGDDAAGGLAAEGERRQLTVLFCDLVGSTQLAGRLDPEDWRDVVRSYQELAGQAIGRFEGHVAQYLGDGILVYFGYPRAHEDDPERAIRASLDLVAGLQGLNERLESEHGLRLAVRIGIHTGPVVLASMGRGSRSERLALGDTTNVAARLADVAEPDTIVVSETTHRLSSGRFEARDLGTPDLPGVAATIRTFAVLRATGARGRLAPAATLTPLVGREREVAALREHWGRARAGEGHAVLVSGEAGVGKSRLLVALRDPAAGDGPVWLECRCSPYAQGRAFHPLVELLSQSLGLTEGDSAGERLARIRRGVRAAGLPESEAVEALTTLLPLPGPAPPPSPRSPDVQRERILELLVDWALALGRKDPVVLVVEDLHWSDPSTLELLGRLIARLPEAKALLLLTFRPGFEPPWSADLPAERLAVERLDAGAARRVVDALTRDRPLPDGVPERIVERADGVPLFLEELTKTLRDSHEDQAIPATLHDSLMARLDRLGEARALAQLASVLGREFSYELLRDVAPWSEDVVRRGVARLVEAEVLEPRGPRRPDAYAFRHAMLQEAAHGSLLRRARQQAHARVAEVLETRHPERVRAEPERVAHHYEEAGLTRKAVEAYGRAGERAMQQSAVAEAIGHLERALALLVELPDNPERQRAELRLRVALAPALTAARGWGDGQTGAAYERAHELVRQIGGTRDLPRILEGLAVFHFVRGDLARSTAFAQQTLEAAEREGDELERLGAHLALGQPLFFRGEFERALHHVEQAVAAYDPARHAAFAAMAGNDRGVNGLSFAGLCHWYLGRFDRAVACSGEAVALARRIEHPMSLVSALFWEGVVRALRRETSAVRRLADAIITLAEERAFPLYRSLGLLLRGWARAEAGEAEKGRREIEEAFGTLARSATGIGAPMYIGALAECHRHLGNHEQALAVLDLGVDRSERMGQPFYDAELRRLRAAIVLDRDGPGSAEAQALLDESLAIARRQGARAFELRAAAAMARLRAARGEKEAARDLLAPVHAAFAEGHDTADLREARALLDSLGGPAGAAGG